LLLPNEDLFTRKRYFFSNLFRCVSQSSFNVLLSFLNVTNSQGYRRRTCGEESTELVLAYNRRPRIRCWMITVENRHLAKPGQRALLLGELSRFGTNPVLQNG
jgi:hypothetical protein